MWTGREVYTSRPSPHGSGHSPCRNRSAIAAKRTVQTLMGNQCSPDCRRGTGVIPDPRSVNDGSMWNFFSAANGSKLLFLKRYDNRMTLAISLNKLNISDIYCLSSVYKKRCLNRVLNWPKRYEIIKNTQLRLSLVGVAEWKSDQIRMIQENYFYVWAKIFTLRPVLPFDHHPHAWTMA